MSSMRSTVFWVLFVTGLVGYAYFVEYKGGAQKQEQEEFQKQVVQLKKEEVTGIKISNSKGQYSLLKENGVWNIKTPREDLGDSDIIDVFISQLITEKYEDIVAEGATIDFSIYGLKENFNTVVFEASGKTQEILIGTETAVGNFRYVRRKDENKVLLVSTAWEFQVERDLSDFVSKELVPRKENIQKISLKNKNGTFNFELQNEKWMLHEVVTGDADQIQINQMHNIVRSLRASRFYKDDLADAPSLNLNAVELVLNYTNGTPDLKIQMSDVNAKREVYATSTDRKGIYVVNENTMKGLLQTLTDFRDRKRPFRFYDGDVEYLEYRSDLVTLHLQKKEDTWISLEDLKGKLIDQDQVQVLLGKITDLKVKKFFDKDIPYQKSGLTEFRLMGKDKKELLTLKWSSRPQGDLFITTSNLSEFPVGVDIKDLGALPVQSIIMDPPVKVEPSKEEPSKGSNENNS